MPGSVVDLYWVDSPGAFEGKMRKVLDVYSGLIEPFELCRSASGVSVPGYQMGQGEREVFFLGRVHGHEPAGTCGLVAFMEGLVSGRVPGSEKHFESAGKVLGAFRLNVFPLVNPTGAERFSRQVKNSFLCDQFEYSEEEFQKVVTVLHEPGLALKKRRLPYYSPEEVKVLDVIGKPMGSMFTEDGVELWKDWAYSRANQTRALQSLMKASKPVLLVDVHQHEHPTTVFTPTNLKDRDVDLYKRLGSAVYDSLEATSLPFEPSRKVEPYIAKHDMDQSVCWAYQNFGTTQFLYEVDGGYRYPSQFPKDSLAPLLPTISKEQVILSVWHGLIRLLLEML